MTEIFSDLHDLSITVLPAPSALGIDLPINALVLAVQENTNFGRRTSGVKEFIIPIGPPSRITPPEKKIASLASLRDSPQSPSISGRRLHETEYREGMAEDLW